MKERKTKDITKKKKKHTHTHIKKTRNDLTNKLQLRGVRNKEERKKNERVKEKTEE